MKKVLLSLIAAAAICPAQTAKPKLVVAVVFDQFRYDYLERFRSEFHGGFDRLLTHGAVLTNARYQHYPTVTAIGHSTFLSGALPATSGIIGNEWYDRDDKAVVTSVTDADTRMLGAPRGTGASPRRLLVSTVGDELKMAHGAQSRIIGVSLKDRAAILPAGHMADAAYWLDAATGNFVSSSYYFEDVPAWVKDFNKEHTIDRYCGAKWLGHLLPAEPPALYSAIPATPFGNEMIESFVEHAVESEQLGRHQETDLLAVSFSSNDYVGHRYGPDSPEVHDVTLQSDVLLEKLFRALDRQIGLDHVLVVMIADHGVAPIPEVNAGRHMPGGRVPSKTVTDTVQRALQARYGNFDWITSSTDGFVYLNWEQIALKKLDVAEVAHTAAKAAESIPHVFRVFTRDQLTAGIAPQDVNGRDVVNGYFARRGADLEVLLEPYWLFGATGTTHSTTFDYDTHVPVIFMGPEIRAGRYYQSATVNDVAPTLASILRVEIPSGSAGRILGEILR